MLICNIFFYSFNSHLGYVCVTNEISIVKAVTNWNHCKLLNGINSRWASVTLLCFIDRKWPLKNRNLILSIFLMVAANVGTSFYCFEHTTHVAFCSKFSRFHLFCNFFSSPFYSTSSIQFLAACSCVSVNWNKS